MKIYFSKDISHLFVVFQINFTMTEVKNPWSIESIYDFQYFICPKCNYQNHSKQEFVNHAFEIHPEAVDHLCKTQDDSLNDIFCPWIIPDLKIKEEIVNEDLIKQNSQIKEEIESSPDEQIIENFENEKNISCTLCGDPFFSFEDLRTHISVFHEDTKSTYKCDKCEKTFTQKRGLKNHNKIFHEKVKKFKCLKCGQTFGKSSNLKEHLKNVHHDLIKSELIEDKTTLSSSENIKNDEDSKINCDMCNKTFTQKSSLKDHIKIGMH